MNRRRFLGTTGIATCALVAGISPLLTGCSAYPMVKVKPVDNIISVAKSQFLQGNKVIIRTPQLEYDIFLHKQSEDAFMAVLLQCSHQNQPLTVSDKQIYCPSHGSTFTLDGQVTKAPAKGPLKIYRTTLSTDNQFINIHLT